MICILTYIMNFKHPYSLSICILLAFREKMSSSSSSSGKATISLTGSKSGRELCFLCDLPRMPWAMVHDFSGMRWFPKFKC